MTIAEAAVRTTDEHLFGSLAQKGEDQYLTFRLAAEEYAIEILRVQEIRGYSAITPIPNMPASMKGFLNLRGAVVPVFDLRIRFGIKDVEYNPFTVIIVANVQQQVVGLVVDSVSEVLTIKAADVEPPPELGGDVDTSFLTGVAKAGESLVALLTIEKVVPIRANAPPSA